jgi:hypothetical protein
LTSLLARTTKMPVREVKDDMAIKPDHIYVIPPNTNIASSFGKLKLSPLGDSGVPHPVDQFFSSLVAEQPGGPKKRSHVINLNFGNRMRLFCRPWSDFRFLFRHMNGLLCSPDLNTSLAKHFIACFDGFGKSLQIALVFFIIHTIFSD